MRKIVLTNGGFALVDDEDYEHIYRHKWRRDRDGYAVRTAPVDYGPKTILMHRLILDAPRSSSVDHVSGDRLDNRRSNLRLATNAQNSMNRLPYEGKTSRYKGVSWHRRVKKWMAGITVNGKGIYLGYFSEEEEAAKAYNNAATRYFGEFARINVMAG